MDKRVIIAAVVAAVVFGAAGFGGGVLLGRAGGRNGPVGARAAWMNGASGRNGANAQGRGAAVGKVTAKDATSFTVKMPDGSSRTVYYSASTRFSKVSTATAKDVSVDETVTAVGQTTSSGDVTAQNVTIGEFGGMMGFRGAFGGNRPNNSGNAGQNGGGPQQGGGDGGPQGGPPPGF